MTQPSAVSSPAQQETSATPATSVAGAATAAHSTHTAAHALSDWQSTPSSAPGIGDAIQVAGGLVLIIGVILGLGVLLKRLGNGHIRRGGKRVLNIIDAQTVGSKERIAVMEIDDTWLVVGVTAQGISTLHTLPRPREREDDAPRASAAPLRMSFTQALREAARRTLGRNAASSPSPPPTSRDDRNESDHA